ncbi:protein kinase domain-containing protein [Aerosakkonema funiforme]|uniref:protein kinase domain-containing protein n=1 Tax=Aerosakkonema funiforme TaxID=1246630 RepID=UPI0035BB8C87
MPSFLGLGSIVKNQYLIQHTFKQENFECVYLVEDQGERSEKYLLREFISREASEAAKFEQDGQQELKILKDLKHPQIQQVKDFFWEGEHLFIVQSYIEGQSYQERLRSHSPLTEQEATQLLQQILPVLSYLHRQQLAHRDISPNNLLLRSQDNLPILTNFGVIRDIMAQMGVETTETRLIDEVRKLPVGFISPGSGEDLYTLAVTIAMLLTGKDVEVLFNSQTQSWDWERYKLVSDQFAEVLNRMLSVQAANRFPSADAILQALNSPVTVPIPQSISQASPVSNFSNHYASSQTISSASPANWSETTVSSGNRKLAPDKNWLIPLGIGILLTLVGILAVMLAQRAPNSQQTSITSPSPTNISTASPTETTQNTTATITQQEAVNLIDQWLRSKKDVYAYPYNFQIPAQYTTGKYLDKTIGTINWLKNNNAYYTYESPIVTQNGGFFVEANQATIVVNIIENRTLYVNGRIDRTKTGPTSGVYRFTMQLENGNWKIADSQEIN